MIEETMQGQPGGIQNPQPSHQESEDMKKLRTLVYEVFHTPSGEQLLKLLEDKHIYKLSWAPGAPEGYAQFRAGQNDVVMFLRQSLEQVKKGQELPEQGGNQQ